jgi:hypothetical protein
MRTLKLEKALESPLDDDDEKLVAAAGEALTELQLGSALKTCDWPTSFEDGPLANTSHRGAIVEVVAVSGIRGAHAFFVTEICRERWMTYLPEWLQLGICRWTAASHQSLLLIRKVATPSTHVSASLGSGPSVSGAREWTHLNQR